MFSLLCFVIFNVTGDVERFVVEDVEQRHRIISSIHNSSHFGVNRTTDMVSDKYYWPSLTLQVRSYVSYIISLYAITTAKIIAMGGGGASVIFMAYMNIYCLKDMSPLFQHIKS